ncbi:MAG: YHS domain-containing protein, partial [Armatimonadetes bacterium]|nr:YHS domain-containing protein [Armatimonadota bacterium]
MFKKLMISVLALCCALSLASASPKHAGHHPAQKSKHVTKKVVIKDAPLVCPVTGKIIPSKVKATGSYVYKGVRYFFCCQACRAPFVKDPAK